MFMNILNEIKGYSLRILSQNLHLTAIQFTNILINK